MIALPSMGFGPDGKLMFCWDRDEHHLELEIEPGQLPEIFYRNRETDEYWGGFYDDHNFKSALQKMYDVQLL